MRTEDNEEMFNKCWKIDFQADLSPVMTKKFRDPVRSRNQETVDTLNQHTSRSARLQISQKSAKAKKQPLKRKKGKNLLEIPVYRDTKASGLRKTARKLEVSDLSVADTLSSFPWTTKKGGVDKNLKGFVDFLRKVLKYEKILEGLKIELSMCPDYTHEALFSIFEYENSKFVYHNDLSSVWKENKITVDDYSVELFVHRHDRDSDGRLNFYEFCDAFGPFRQEYAILVSEREIKDLKKYKTKGMKAFSQETRHKLSALLEQVFRCEIEIEHLRQQTNFDSENPLRIFRKFDKNGKGRVTKRDLKDGFKKAGYCITMQEVGLLFNRFHKK